MTSCRECLFCFVPGPSSATKSKFDYAAGSEPVREINTSTKPSRASAAHRVDAVVSRFVSVTRNLAWWIHLRHTANHVKMLILASDRLGGQTAGKVPFVVHRSAVSATMDMGVGYRGLVKLVDAHDMFVWEDGGCNCRISDGGVFDGCSLKQVLLSRFAEAEQTCFIEFQVPPICRPVINTVCSCSTVTCVSVFGGHA